MKALHDPIELIQRSLDEWDDVPPVEADIFETASASAIADSITGFCERHLGAGVAGYLFCASGIGSSHGVKLTDGRVVMIKVRPPADTNPDMIHSREGLSVICEALKWLHARGFPCPELLLGPVPLGRGLATAEAFIEGGRRGDAFQAADRKIIAAGLAELIRLLRSFEGDAQYLQRRTSREALYPQPHSRIFDFEKTAARAEWIDEFARRARRGMDHEGACVLGHADWRVEHIRFQGGRMVAVFDWDSLVYRQETAIVGGAAAGFTADWSRQEVRRVPTGADIRAFLADYEQARGRAFSARERQCILASCVYSLAYGARCAHATAPDKTAWKEDSWPHLLRAEGDALLAEASRVG